MAPESSHHERDIFGAALERATAAERAAYLDGACGGDAALRGRIEELLRAHAAAGGFLADANAGENGADAVEVAVREGPGSRIGRYKLLECIGEGGFGVVYLAEQEEPVRRRVALKIIKLGMDTRAVVARFEAERQALALMDHPSIAKVFDGGATETGRPYFVMELVRGVPLTTFCDEQRLTMRDRIGLFTQVCHAVQHAHQKGVIHRDLKPSNILVTMHDERPVPKVIDFGIAKATEQRLTEKTLFTRFHQFIGTPAYMSPEQTGISGLDVDTRSDIYGLGVVLYELLAGRTPFDAATLLAAGYAEIERTIREQDPPAPSQRLATLTRDEQTTTAQRRRTDAGRLTGHLRGDLDRIVLKCLQKDRARRYETASGLAQDLSRYLHDEPVLARPDAWAYRARKFVRRHRASVGFALLVGLVLVAGLIGTITQARRAIRYAVRADAERQRADLLAQEAVQQRDFALRQLSRAEAVNELNEYLLFDAFPGKQPVTVEQMLDRAEELVNRETHESLENRIHLLLAIGHYFSVSDRQDRSYAACLKAYGLARNHPDPLLRADAAAGLSQPMADRAELDRAEALFQEALTALGRAPPWAVQHAQVLMCGRHVAGLRGDIALAIERVAAADKVLRDADVGSPVLRMRVTMALASDYASAGRHREAAAAFATAWERITALGRSDTDLAVGLLNNWALTEYILGHGAAAVTLFRRALAANGLDPEHPNGGSPMVLINLARSLHDTWNLDSAAALAEQACAQARRDGAEIIVNQSLLLLCTIRRDRGELTRAADALAEVEPRLEQMMPAGHYAFASIEFQRAALLLAQGDADAALTAADKAVALFEANAMGGQFLAPVLLRRSEIHLRRQQFAGARADAERALALDREVAAPGEHNSRLGRDWLALARVLQAQGGHDAARGAFASAFEHLRPTLGDEHPQTREAAAGAQPP